MFYISYFCVWLLQRSELGLFEIGNKVLQTGESGRLSLLPNSLLLKVCNIHMTLGQFLHVFFYSSWAWSVPTQRGDDSPGFKAGPASLLCSLSSQWWDHIGYIRLALKWTPLLTYFQPLWGQLINVCCCSLFSSIPMTHDQRKGCVYGTTLSQHLLLCFVFCQLWYFCRSYIIVGILSFQRLYALQIYK